MPITPESLYRQLGALLAAFPTDLPGPGELSVDSQRWLGRASALLGARAKLDHSALMDRIQFDVAVNNIRGPLREGNVQTITATLYRALAAAEVAAPAAAQGAFISVAAPFDFFQAIGRVFGEARREVLIVDAYADASILTDFAPLIAENVSVGVMFDGNQIAPNLVPAVRRWVAQYGAKRPLDVRATAPRLLHDRLVVIDRARMWSLTQSFKDFARRSPATVLRVDDEVGAAKVAAYEDLWAAAQQI